MHVQRTVVVRLLVTFVLSSMTTPLIAHEPYHHPDMDLPDELCDRSRSRKVRTMIREIVLTELPDEMDGDSDEDDGGGYEFPEGCQLDPELDMQLEHEQNKQMVHSREWKCNYCGKRFKTEAYLDKHMHRKHSSHLNGTVCLADLCDVFGCDMGPTQGSVGSKNLESLRKKCDEKEMKRMAYRCNALIQRCFPPEESDLAHRLAGVLGKKLCGGFTCETGADEDAGSAFKDDSGRRVSSSGYRALLIVVCTCLFFYLCGLCIHYSENSTSSSRLKSLTPSFSFRRRSRLDKLKDF